jgi:hypothetical protein
MELRHLRYFDAVAQMENVSRAARQLLKENSFYRLFGEAPKEHAKAHALPRAQRPNRSPDAIAVLTAASR